MSTERTDYPPYVDPDVPQVDRLLHCMWPEKYPPADWPHSCTDAWSGCLIASRPKRVWRRIKEILDEPVDSIKYYLYERWT